MPPLAVPSSLVSTMPVTSTASANCARLDEAVLPGRRVDHEQHLLAARPRCGRRCGGASSAPPSGCAWCAAGRRCRRARGRRRGSAAAPIASNTTEPGSAPSWPRTISPPVRSAQSCELLGRRGAERVGRGEHDAVAVGDLLRRELADGRGLPDAVHADEHPHVRLARRSACSVAVGVVVEQRDHLVAQQADRARRRRRRPRPWRGRAPRRGAAASSACRRRRAAAPLRARPTSRRRSCGRASTAGSPRTRRASGRAGRAAAACSMTSGSTTARARR